MLLGAGKSKFISNTYPRLNTLIQLLFLPYRGLIFYMPIFILSFIGLCQAVKKKNLELIMSGFCMVMFILLNSGLKWWSGEFCFGPRLLIEAIPFSIILAGPVIGKYKRAYYSIFIYSLFVNFIGVNFRWVANLDGQVIGLFRYVMKFASSGFPDSFLDRFIISIISPRINFFINNLLCYLTLVLILVLISYILFDFRFRPLLSELSNSLKKTLTRFALRILFLSILFSFICVGLNQLLLFLSVGPLRFLLVAFVNFLFMISISMVFKDVFFKKMISIAEE